MVIILRLELTVAVFLGKKLAIFHLRAKQSTRCSAAAWRKTCKQNSFCVGVAWQTQDIQHMVQTKKKNLQILSYAFNMHIMP